MKTPAPVYAITERCASALVAKAIEMSAQGNASIQAIDGSWGLF